MILMNFFSRVTYNDRMSPLDYDLFRKTQSLMGVTPDFFEVCLMVSFEEGLARRGEGRRKLRADRRCEDCDRSTPIPRSTPIRWATSLGRCRTTT